MAVSREKVLLKRLGLLTGTGRERGLVRLCHARRLAGGLSVSLGATPDEVLGPLTHAIGGAALTLRVSDVRTGPPMVIHIEWGELKEKWEVRDVAALVHNLNDLFKSEPDARLVVVLGEWEDMLQLWPVERGALAKLLEARLLDDAFNVAALRRALEPPEDDGWRGDD
jgi:hypothetical protein